MVCPAVHILGSQNVYGRVEGIADHYWLPLPCCALVIFDYSRKGRSSKRYMMFCMIQRVGWGGDRRTWGKVGLRQQSSIKVSQVYLGSDDDIQWCYSVVWLFSFAEIVWGIWNRWHNAFAADVRLLQLSSFKNGGKKPTKAHTYILSLFKCN